MSWCLATCVYAGRKLTTAISHNNNNNNNYKSVLFRLLPGKSVTLRRFCDLRRKRKR